MIVTVILSGGSGTRLWGYFDSLDFGDSFQVKRLSINPGEKISLPKHHYRTEHWVVVK